MMIAVMVMVLWTFHNKSYSQARFCFNFRIYVRISLISHQRAVHDSTSGCVFDCCQSSWWDSKRAKKVSSVGSKVMFCNW